ncbi:DUF1796 family putative cysteine peptidase [Methylobacterium ajmalii]|uniref:DUF1796 family putative cysteine peptidase n=1 Tax=Methylobacterium ajmalii TaxID=2738439 RepID=A0ABU9ZYA7_9HYPH
MASITYVKKHLYIAETCVSDSWEGDMYTKLENEVISKVVDGLYRVLLGREPDESGHDFHFNNIMANYKSGAFEEVLRGFISSKEIYESNLEKYRNSELKKFGKEIKNIYEDNVFSLGTHCYTSYMLKVAGLKVFSGPFDWLFSSCSLIEDCFSDNFEKFLDKSFYETVPIDKRAHQHVNKCDHRYFKGKIRNKLCIQS